MGVELRIDGLITVAGREFALGQTFALLDAIHETRSVSQAAGRLGLSYRTVWGRLLALEDAVGQPLVTKTKGHGSVLTARGLGLRDALGATLQAFKAALQREEQALRERLTGILVDASAPGLVRLSVSHDPLLLEVLSGMDGLVVDVVGSREAVERLVAGRTDVAGFHAGSERVLEHSPFGSLLHKEDYAVKPLFWREQGLFLAPGNPLRIGSVEDLAVTGARFVNRQRGSGTRLWFDRLLGEAGIPPAAIRGYGVEEFTHQAVAALIASGAADAGMGARAAAERFGLAFVPVGVEAYFLASRGSSPGTDMMNRVIAALHTSKKAESGYTFVNEAVDIPIAP